jgi:hypothetical protein
VDTVVAHHAPSPRRDDWSARWARYRRNDTLTAVLRLPWQQAVLEVARLLADGVREPAVRPEIRQLFRVLHTALGDRRSVPPELARRLAEALLPDEDGGPAEDMDGDMEEAECQTHG